MVKKNRKRTGYSLIVASGLLLLVGVLLYGLYYVNDVRTELWDSSLSTIIENTDRASDMVAGKINAEKRSLQVQVNSLESLDSTDTDTISFLLNGFDSKEYSTLDYGIPGVWIVTLVVLGTLIRILKVPVRHYMVYLILAFLGSLVPAFLLAGSLVKCRIPSVICVAAGVMLLCGLAIFKGRELAEELKKNAHI